MPLEQVVCPNCECNAEYKISGPQAKNPGRIYWSCPQCPSKDGKGSLFIKFEEEPSGKPISSPFKRPAQEAQPAPAQKKQKVELRPRIEDPMPQWAKILMEKTDIILSKFERVFEIIEPVPQEDEETQDEPWQSSQKHVPNYIV